MSLADALRLTFLAIAVLGLLWTLANVIEAWRITGLRIVFRRRRPSNVLRFPERNRAS